MPGNVARTGTPSRQGVVTSLLQEWLPLKLPSLARGDEEKPLEEPGLAVVRISSVDIAKIKAILRASAERKKPPRRPGKAEVVAEEEAVPVLESASWTRMTLPLITPPWTREDLQKILF